MSIATVVDDDSGEVYGLLERDADRLAMMLRAFESGALWPKRHPARLMGQGGATPGIKFKNNNAGTCPGWGLLRITGYTKATGAADAYFTIDQPDGTYRWLYLVNGKEEVTTGDYGYGTFLDGSLHNDEDWSYILYEASATPTVGEEWGPQDGSWKIKQHRPGFIIAGGQITDDSGKERLVATQRMPRTVLGKTDASVQGGNTVTVSLYSGGTVGSELDTSLDISTCYLRYGYVPSSAWVHVTLIHGKPYIIDDDHRTLIVKADSTIAKGSSGTCSIYSGGTDTTDNISAEALGSAVTGSKWATAWLEEKTSQWYVACWET